MSAATKTYVCKVCNTEVTRLLDKRKKQIYCSTYCAAQMLRVSRDILKPDVKAFSGKTRLINDKYIVNEEYYEWLSQWKWHTSSTGYAVYRNWFEDGKKQTLRMHRLIAGTPNGMVTDHKNGNKFDNRDSNLRNVTQRENIANRHGTVGYTWDESKGKWMVRYKNKFYGRYDTELKAQRAYKLACSGVEYVKSRRKYYHLPTGISKQFGKYKVRPQREGVKYWLGAFDKLDDAQLALDTFNQEGGYRH